MEIHVESGCLIIMVNHGKPCRNLVSHANNDYNAMPFIQLGLTRPYHGPHKQITAFRLSGSRSDRGLKLALSSYAAKRQLKENNYIKTPYAYDAKQLLWWINSINLWFVRAAPRKLGFQKNERAKLLPFSVKPLTVPWEERAEVEMRRPWARYVFNLIHFMLTCILDKGSIDFAKLCTHTFSDGL